MFVDNWTRQASPDNQKILDTQSLDREGLTVGNSCFIMIQGIY